MIARTWGWFFGFRPARYAEWRELVRLELEGKLWRERLGIWRRMLWFFLTGRKVNRCGWRNRMRTCRRCPLHDRTCHRCRPFEWQTDLGCGCWTPLVGLYEEHCWGYNNLPEDGIGW